MLELVMVSASNNRIGNVMSIVKRGNSKNWYMYFEFNGQPYIRSSRTTNKKIAESMEIEWKAMLDKNFLENARFTYTKNQFLHY
jgi:hypothetical protein